jgi:hypothetical protein
MDGRAKWLESGPGRLASENATAKTRTSLNAEILSRFTIRPYLNSENHEKYVSQFTKRETRQTLIFLPVSGAISLIALLVAGSTTVMSVCLYRLGGRSSTDGPTGLNLPLYESQMVFV